MRQLICALLIATQSVLIQTAGAQTGGTQANTFINPLTVKATQRLLAAPLRPHTFKLKEDDRTVTVTLKLPAGMAPLPWPNGKASSNMMIRRTDTAQNLGLSMDVRIVSTFNSFLTTGKVTTTRRGRQTLTLIRYHSGNTSLRITTPLGSDFELQCSADLDTRSVPATLREQAINRADAICSSLTLSGWN